MTIWGLGTALIGVTCLIVGLALGYGWGASEPKRSGWEAPGRCTWQEVQRPKSEQSLTEREYDEMIDYYQKEHP